jgi:dienelactone hydrolase
LEKLKLGVADTAKSFMIDMWLARHTPEKVLPLLHNVIEGIKDEFADAIANGGGIYAVGYCFGAKYVLLLGGKEQHHDPASKGQGEGDEEQAAALVGGPIIKAAAIAHGTSITTEDLEQLQVPTCLVCVENDPLFPGEVLEAGVKVLEKHGVAHKVKVYPEVPHGFAVYGDYDSVAIKSAQRSAFGQMLEWLKAN